MSHFAIYLKLTQHCKSIILQLKNMKRNKMRARVKSKRSKCSMMDWAECSEQPIYLLLSKSTEQSDL